MGEAMIVFGYSEKAVLLDERSARWVAEMSWFAGGARTSAVAALCLACVDDSVRTTLRDGRYRSHSLGGSARGATIKVDTILKRVEFRPVENIFAAMELLGLWGHHDGNRSAEYIRLREVTDGDITAIFLALST